jgi:hypothetical protein
MQHLFASRWRGWERLVTNAAADGDGGSKTASGNRTGNDENLLPPTMVPSRREVLRRCVGSSVSTASVAWSFAFVLWKKMIDDEKILRPEVPLGTDVSFG